MLTIYPIDFEEAAKLRDQVKELEDAHLKL